MAITGSQTSGLGFLKADGSVPLTADWAVGNKALTGAASYNGLVVTANTGAITTGSWAATIIPGQFGGTGVANTGKTITLGGNLTTSGAFAIVFTATAGTNITLPTTGTLATLAGAEAFTNKTYNGNTFTAGTGVLTIASSKTITVNNTLTLSATDGSTLNIGTGGTLGSNAYTSTAYAPIASPTFTGSIITPIVYGSASSLGTLLLRGNSSSANGHVYIGSTTTLDIDETNSNLGIGTAASTTERLYIVKSTNATNNFRQQNSTNGTASIIQYQQQSDWGSSYFITTSTNVTTSGAYTGKRTYLQSGGNGFTLSVPSGKNILFSFDDLGTNNSSWTALGLYLGGATSATAYLQLAAGTTASSTGPLKFSSSGTGVTGLLTTPEAGVFEFTTYGFWVTPTSATRHKMWEGLIGASAPSTSVLTAFVNYYGIGGTVALSTPNTWATITGDDGNVYKIPAYS